MLYACPETAEAIARDVDKFGDLYAVDATLDGLKEACAEVRKQVRCKHGVCQRIRARKI